MSKEMIKMYLHGSKDDNYETGEELELSEQALDVFKYALYEVEFDVEVDTETGETKIKKCNDMLLISESELSTLREV